MRIERIRIDAFGRLQDFDTGGNALGDLVCVLGPNEAGKSTLFNFLTTTLYGFHPASRERNPHVPWGADEASGRIEVTVGDGQCAQVERRLRASPSGRLTEGGVTRDLANRPVPWAEHVPSKVFQQVFAITLADLAALEPDTWARVQDRLLGSMGSSDLVPARAVADALEQEASELWRPNRRGNQRVRELQAEIRAARAQRNGALERDREVRRLVEERENVLVRLREVRADREEERAALDRLKTLVPLHRQLERVEALRRDGGERSELAALPDDPPAALQELSVRRARISRRLDDIDAALAEPQRTVEEFGPGAATLLERETELSRFFSRVAEARPERRRARELAAEIDELALRRSAAFEQLFEGAWGPPAADAVTGLSVELVEDRIDRVRAGSSAEGAEASRAEAASDPSLRQTRWWAAAIAVAGLAILVWGLLGGPSVATILGAVLATAGVVVALLKRGDGVTGVPDTPPGSTDAERARSELEAMLGALPLRAELLDPPGPALVTGLRRLQELTLAERERIGARAAAQAIVDRVDGLARELAGRLGRETDDAESLAASLDQELRSAARLRDAADAAARELSRLRRDRLREAEELEEVDQALAALRRALERFNDDPTRAATVAKRRIDAHRRADQLGEELERTHVNLAELTARLREGGALAEASLDDVELARRTAHVEELESQIERFLTEAEALERDAAHLREMETVDAVDSEIESLREQEARLIRERDRKWVLGQLVREADRRFREEHQPDLVRRASEHLAHLTGGRYQKLLVDETRADGLFHIMGPRLPAPIPLAHPISTGTLEQAYLSLRLAIVDHLDEGRERLPLFIDEAFVNWDRERRDRGLDVLAELSERRQLFVFTCHPAIAAHLEGNGGRVIELLRRR